MPGVHFIFQLWNSVLVVAAITYILDFAGVADLVAVLITRRASKYADNSEKKERLDRRANWMTGAAAALWILDAVFNHRLAVLQQRDFDKEISALRTKLASVKTLKDRLVEWLNRLNPIILQRAQAGQFSSRVTMGQLEFNQFTSMLGETDAGSYVELPLGNIQENIVGGGPITVDSTIVIRPALLKPKSVEK